ncbi:DNA gyrase inhibitor YacG [Marinagarivorans algicola]|uniref:DNA gyrase inhibitor YacG n=1 Tax=Marinagarivorans algicola TaxID=1513270 RepID=UPI0006B4AF1E|nr:DNA gyrase inhibitor YacG [Marinagarivorans algicola]
MTTKTLSIPCPNCKKTVFMTEQFPNRPFCSKRCQLIDLGEWASESRRIAGSHNDEDAELWSEGTP